MTIITEREIEEIVEASLDHAREHNYRPGEDDDDMLQTAIIEEATRMGLELSQREERAAVERMRARLEELEDNPTPAGMR